MIGLKCLMFECEFESEWLFWTRTRDLHYLPLNSCIQTYMHASSYHKLKYIRLNLILITFLTVFTAYYDNIFSHSFIYSIASICIFKYFVSILTF